MHEMGMKILFEKLFRPGLPFLVCSLFVLHSNLSVSSIFRLLLARRYWRNRITIERFWKEWNSTRKQLSHSKKREQVIKVEVIVNMSNWISVIFLFWLIVFLLYDFHEIWKHWKEEYCPYAVKIFLVLILWPYKSLSTFRI